MIRLESERLRVEVLPEHGCTITSIVDRPSGVELLWSGARRPLPSDLGPTGEASRDYFERCVFIGGWFPMFPMAGGPGSRTDVRLHGEAPRIGWDVVHDDGTRLTTEALLTDSVLLTRRTQLDGAKLSVITEACNGSPDPFEVLAAGEHPCFDLQQLGITALRSAGSWTPLIRDEHVEHAVGHGVGEARLRCSKPDFDLELRWDREELPGLLTWRRGHEILAVEPKTFVGRSADDVGARHRTLAVGETMTWSLSVNLLARDSDGWG